MLKERYGIEYRQIALCIVNRSTRNYADSYDQLSASAAKAKFHRDVFKETADDAHRIWLHRLHYDAQSHT